jgi:hypothetical protein
MLAGRKYLGERLVQDFYRLLLLSEPMFVTDRPCASWVPDPLKLLQALQPHYQIHRQQFKPYKSHLLTENHHQFQDACLLV